MDAGKLSRTAFYRCPECGKIITASGPVEVNCCGHALKALESRNPDEEHNVEVEKINDEYLLRIHHPMAKDHYIAFVALIRDDRCLIQRLYPEGSTEIYIPYIGRRTRLLWCCTRDGLFSHS